MDYLYYKLIALEKSINEYFLYYNTINNNLTSKIANDSKLLIEFIAVNKLDYSSINTCVNDFILIQSMNIIEKKILEIYLWLNLCNILDNQKLILNTYKKLIISYFFEGNDVLRFPIKEEQNDYYYLPRKLISYIRELFSTNNLTNLIKNNSNIISAYLFEWIIFLRSDSLKLLSNFGFKSNNIIQSKLSFYFPPEFRMSYKYTIYYFNLNHYKDKNNYYTYYNYSYTLKLLEIHQYLFK